jgi:hypothetical protein
MTGVGVGVVPDGASDVPSASQNASSGPASRPHVGHRRVAALVTGCVVAWGVAGWGDASAVAAGWGVGAWGVASAAAGSVVVAVGPAGSSGSDTAQTSVKGRAWLAASM